MESYYDRVKAQENKCGELKQKLGLFIFRPFTDTDGIPSFDSSVGVNEDNWEHVEYIYTFHHFKKLKRDYVIIEYYEDGTAVESIYIPIDKLIIKFEYF